MWHALSHNTQLQRELRPPVPVAHRSSHGQWRSTCAAGFRTVHQKICGEEKKRTLQESGAFRAETAARVAFTTRKGVNTLHPAGMALVEPMLPPGVAVAINESDAGQQADAKATRPKSKATMCRLFGLLDRREACQCFLAVLFTSVASVTGMALPVFTGKLVSSVTTDKGFSPECLQDAAALAHCRRDHLMHLLLIMGVAFTVSGLSLACGFWLFRYSGERLVARLRKRLFAAYLYQDMAFFDEQKTGELMNRLASDCTEMQETLTRTLGEGMHNVIQVAVGLTLMAISSPRLTGLSLTSVPLIAVFAAVYGVFVAKLSERYQAALADASDVAQQTLSSFRTVRSFAMELFEKQRYDASVGQSFRLGARKAAAVSRAPDSCHRY